MPKYTITKIEKTNRVTIDSVGPMYLDELVNHFKTPLESGEALKQSVGMFSVNSSPKTIDELLDNLNMASSNIDERDVFYTYDIFQEDKTGKEVIEMIQYGDAVCAYDKNAERLAELCDLLLTKKTRKNGERQSFSGFMYREIDNIQRRLEKNNVILDIERG